jgi:hypothetical protein
MSSQQNDRGQIYLVGGPTGRNAVFTFTIYNKSDYEPVFNKIYKGYKIF